MGLGNLADHFTQRDELLAEIRDKLNEPGATPANYGTVLASILSELQIGNSGTGVLPQPRDPRLFAYPADGTRVSLSTVGTYIIDFYQGTIQDPDGAVIQMDKSLQDAHLEFLKSVLISVDYEVVVRFDANDRIPVAGYYSSNEQPFKRVEITITATTNLLIVASSSPTILTLLDGAGAGGGGGSAGATSIHDGRKVVAAAGTALALAASTPCSHVTVVAETDNTDIVVVGSATVVAALATRRGVPLYPGDSYDTDIDNVAEVYIDSLVNGEGVTFVYVL